MTEKYITRGDFIEVTAENHQSLESDVKIGKIVELQDGEDMRFYFQPINGVVLCCGNLKRIAIKLSELNGY